MSTHVRSSIHILPDDLSEVVCHFRSLKHKMPIEIEESYMSAPLVADIEDLTLVLMFY